MTAKTAGSPNPNAQIRRKPFLMRPRHDEVLAALKRCGCFLGPAAQTLGVSRSNLRKQIQGNSRLAAAVADLNEGALDRVEATLWDRAVNEKDVRAAQIILNARGKARGYGLQPGEAVNPGATANLVIQSVVVNAIETGRFVGGGPGMVIEPDEPSVHRGSKLIEPDKLN
jgi:hypothetical protein